MSGEFNYKQRYSREYVENYDLIDWTGEVGGEEIDGEIIPPKRKFPGKVFVTKIKKGRPSKP